MMRNNLDHNAPPKVPAWAWCLVVLMVVLSWLPLVLIARSRAVKTERQPVHLFLDMDFQPRYGPQDYQDESLPVRFNDGRAMRMPVPGTVRHDDGADAVGIDAEHYDHFGFGYELDGNLQPVTEQVEIAGAKVEQSRYFTDFPPNITVDEPFVKRGQQRYNIYCAVCHGRAGYGDGPVQNRVTMRNALTANAIQGWVPPRNLHQADMLDMPVGKLYDRMTRGVFTVDATTGKKSYTMWPYASQVSKADRWAIVAYIKAMQGSQNFPADQLPEDLKAGLENAKTIKKPGGGAPVAAPTGFDEKELNDPALIAQGKVFFTTKLCFTCHQTDKNIIAPAGQAFNAPKYIGEFWGKEHKVHLGVMPDGFTPNPEMGTVVFGPAYFIESIKEPMKKIAEGSRPGMVLQLPPNDDEIKALMAYVKSLSKPE